MTGERHSFAQSVPVVLDQLRPGKVVGPQYRRIGSDPLDLRPIPTIRVWHKRMQSAVRINVSDFDPERHDKIDNEPIRGHPPPGYRVL